MNKIRALDTRRKVAPPLDTPTDLSEAAVRELSAKLNEILAEEAVRQRLVTAGVVVQGSTPDAFGKLMADEFVRWDKVRETAGIERQ